MTSQFTHQPVLLQQALSALAIQPEGIYVDGTFGRGGHSQAILARLGRQGRLYAIDKDLDAIQFAHYTIKDPRFTILHGSFTQLASFAKQENIDGKINGILLDLGVSSPQLDNPVRGFSFLREGPLDMRMDTSCGQSAKDWVNAAKETEMAQIFKDYGEEKFSKRIARAIVNVRQVSPIQTTTELAKIISEAHPAWEKGKHPATRCFQAIRIFINQELEELQQVLEQATKILAIGGKLAVISFHSLEDRIVKRYFKKISSAASFPKNLPIMAEAMQPAFRLVGKAMFALENEVMENVRSRSAVLRVVEKIA